MTNPLLAIGVEIPFDTVSAEHVEPAIDELLRDAERGIDAIVGDARPPTYASTLGGLERTTERLERALTLIGHLESVATTPALRDAYNTVRPKASAFFAAIPTNGPLYLRLRAFAETAEAAALDPVRRRLLDKTLDDFRRHGAELDEAGKARLREIDVALTVATTKFAQNVLDATNAFELILDDEAKLAGLPDSARQAARANAERKGVPGWRFTLQAPSLIPVLTYLDDRAVRERMHRAHNARATADAFDNRPLVRQILELRREKACLLRFHDFADLVLADRMAKTGGKAMEFVANVEAKTRAAFDLENQSLAAFHREHTGAGAPPLAPWDLAYWSEKQRRALFDFDEEELRPYFSAERVLDGLFSLASKLYGVRVAPKSATRWDDDVRVFGIEDGERPLALLYVDLFPRENKRGGAWMNPLLTNVAADGSIGTHVGVFCANSMPPVGDTPALLTHQDVETLFHEFGHFLHHAFSRVPVRSLAGTNVAWDFVELPSQIMENFCWERVSLDLFARHYETGEPIPEALFQKMRAARTYRAANAQMRQLGFAAMDLALHVAFDPAADGDPLAFARRELAKRSPVPIPDDQDMVASFTHLFGSPTGYAAGYYSYKWAEVLDADAFTRFEKAGVLAPEIGAEFRRMILERGDAEPPEKLFHDFMGRDPSIDALLLRAGLAA